MPSRLRSLPVHPIFAGRVLRRARGPVGGKPYSAHKVALQHQAGKPYRTGTEDRGRVAPGFRGRFCGHSLRSAMKRVVEFYRKCGGFSAGILVLGAEAPDQIDQPRRRNNPPKYLRPFPDPAQARPPPRSGLAGSLGIPRPLLILPVWAQTPPKVRLRVVRKLHSAVSWGLRGPGFAGAASPNPPCPWPFGEGPLCMGAPWGLPCVCLTEATLPSRFHR